MYGNAQSANKKEFLFNFCEEYIKALLKRIHFFFIAVTTALCLSEQENENGIGF